MFELLKHKLAPNPVPAKNHYYITGYLNVIISAGQPAEYVYSGNLIRTSTVRQILEVSENYITFETTNSFYTLSYLRNPSEQYALCA